MQNKKIHLGQFDLPGYIRVDDIKTIEPNSIDEIYACHVLQYLSKQELVPTIISWNKILKIGGILRLSVPDFEAIVKVYRNNPLSLHKSLLDFFDGLPFDFINLQDLLEQIGFGPIERYKWEEFLPKNYKDQSQSYFPHNDIIMGRLMSLNIIAIKIS